MSRNSVTILRKYFEISLFSLIWFLNQSLQGKFVKSFICTKFVQSSWDQRSNCLFLYLSHMTNYLCYLWIWPKAGNRQSILTTIFNLISVGRSRKGIRNFKTTLFTYTKIQTKISPTSQQKIIHLKADLDSHLSDSFCQNRIISQVSYLNFFFVFHITTS